MKKGDFNEEGIAQIESEMEILKKLSHPHIISTKELMHDKHRYYLSSEFCQGGNLLKRLIDVKQSLYGSSSPKAFTEQNASYVISQVLLAIRSIHH